MKDLLKENISRETAQEKRRSSKIQEAQKVVRGRYYGKKWYPWTKGSRV